MSQDIRGRTIGQFPLVQQEDLDPATARIPVWREELPDGSRVGAITPDELKDLLIRSGVLTKAEANGLYASIGAVSGGGGAVCIPFAFGDATPKLLAQVGPGLLDRIAIVITTAFNAPSGLAVGIPGQPNLYMTTAMSDPSAVGEYEATPDVFLSAPTSLILTISPGVGITQGRGYVIIQIHP